MEQTQSLASVRNTQIGTRPPIFTAASRIMDCFPKFTAGLCIVFSHIAFKSVRGVVLTTNTQCLYIQGEKWLSLQCLKRDKNWSNNYVQSTSISSYHEENTCKVSKQLVQNCKRSCAHNKYPLSTVQPSTCFYQSRRVVACSGAWKRLNSTQFPRYSRADHTIFSRRVAPPPRRLAPTPRSVGIFRAYLDAARLLLDD